MRTDHVEIETVHSYAPHENLKEYERRPKATQTNSNAFTNTDANEIVRAMGEAASRTNSDWFTNTDANENVKADAMAASYTDSNAFTNTDANKTECDGVSGFSH
ncbi:hypothetical protein PI124_g16474 [Phytophthora idaei]|nr:hypothetical protein PI125_g16272 [Phytophthora idaei]KAG3141192.1 hypothetical protein PI126_g15611 [Phytophthora idaei]KAG3238566.1 hypothetical protein PI124_g16474 [Phytophthora idaei]